jgi:hypothetical protein
LTSRAPCFLARYGKVPVSAQATARAAAGGADDLRHREAAEAARRQEDDLATGEMRRERAGDVVLRGRGQRNDDQLGAGDGGTDVGGRAG